MYIDICVEKEIFVVEANGDNFWNARISQTETKLYVYISYILIHIPMPVAQPFSKLVQLDSWTNKAQRKRNLTPSHLLDKYENDRTNARPMLSVNKPGGW